MTENHVQSGVSRRFTAGPSSHPPAAPASAVAGARGAAGRRQVASLSSQTSSSSLSSSGGGSRRGSVASHSSNLSYSQDDVDSVTGKHDPGAGNLEIHEVKVVFLKVRHSFTALPRPMRRQISPPPFLVFRTLNSSKLTSHRTYLCVRMSLFLLRNGVLLPTIVVVLVQQSVLCVCVSVHVCASKQFQL